MPSFWYFWALWQFFSDRGGLRCKITSCWQLLFSFKNRVATLRLWRQFYSTSNHSFITFSIKQHSRQNFTTSVGLWTNMIHVYPPTPLPYFPFDSKLISYPDFKNTCILFLEFVKKGYLNVWNLLPWNYFDMQCPFNLDTLWYYNNSLVILSFSLSLYLFSETKINPIIVCMQSVWINGYANYSVLS